MESSELSQWLKSIGLSYYSKLFWEAGFRDLKSVASLTDVHLKETGIRNRKTVNKLLREFDKLKSELEGLGSPSSFQVTAGQHAAVYTALYDYDGKGDTDLQIKKGEIITVFDRSREDKWRGLVNQKQGFFPPWVVVEDSSLSASHEMPSDCTEDGSSLSDPKIRKEQEQNAHKQTLLEVAGLPESDEASLSAATCTHTQPTEGESGQWSVNDSTGATLPLNSGNNGQPDLEANSQELATGTTAVSDSKDAGQPNVDPQTSSSDMKHLSPSAASSDGSDETAESSQKLQTPGASHSKGNGAVAELQGNDTSKQENEQRSENGNVSTAPPENSGDLDRVSQELAAGTAAVPDCPKDTGQPSSTKTGSSDRKRMSPSPPTGTDVNDESAKCSQVHKSPGQSNLEHSGTQTSESTENALSSSDDTAKSDGSQEPAKKRSKTDNMTTDTDKPDQKFQTPRHDVESRDKDQNQNTKAVSRPPPGHLQDCPGVSVEFHVIIHEEWMFDPSKGDKSVHIRFGGSPELGNWKWDCVDMELAVDFGITNTKHLRLFGHCIIPKNNTHRTIPYRYVVVQRSGKTKSKSPDFEYIKGGFYDGHVNRALNIPDGLKGKTTGLFRKFDDIIRKQPKWVVPILSRQFHAYEFTDNRILALEALLPRWPGFCGMERASPFYCNFTAEQALQEFDFVVNSIKFVPVWGDKLPESRQESFRPEGFTDATVAETICRHIRPQLEALTKETQEPNRLLSAVALSALVCRYGLHLVFDQLVALLRALKINPDIESRRCIDYEVLIGQFQDLKMAAGAVEHVIRKSCLLTWRHPCEWILALPVLHFLRHDLRPFETPETTDLNSPQWWGLENLLEEVKTSRSPLTLIDEIKPLCSADRLTARSFLCTLTLQELPRVIDDGVAHPPEFLQALQNRLFDISKEIKQNTISKQTIEMLGKFLTKLSAMANETERLDSYKFVDLKVSQTENVCGVVVGVQLLHTMLPLSQDKEMLVLLQRAKDITFRFMHKMVITGEAIDAASQDETSNGNDQRNARQSVDDFTRLQLQKTFRCFSKWMDRNSARSLRSVEPIVEELKERAWNKVLQSNILPDGLRRYWEEVVLSKLNERMRQAEEVPLLEAYCYISDQNLHPIIGQSCEDLSKEIVDRLLKQRGGQEQAVGGLLTQFMRLSKGGDHTATMLKFVLRKCCPKSSPSTHEGWLDWFRHLLSWPLWTTFLRLKGEGSRVIDFLDLEHQLVSRAEIVLSSIVGFLTDRSIHVEQLRLLEKKRGRFLELCKIWDSHQKDKKISDKALLSLRACVVQVEKFDRAKRLVDKFVGACVSVCDPVNGVLSPELRLLSDRIKEDVSSMEVRGLCHFDSEEAAVEAFFHIPPSCRRYLQPIGNAVDSDIFMRIWNEHAREVGQQRCIEQPPNTNPLKLYEITELICAPVIGQWQRICREVQDGSISLERVSTHFGCLTNDPRALTQEMDCISVCSPRRGNNAWKQQRQKQIEQYSRLTDKIEAARTLKNVLGTLEISQRFREVDIICKQVSLEFQQQPISTISDELLSAGKFLSTFTGDLVRCLESFVKTPNLVRWLRPEIKEWKELETFVELAGTKSSEEDFEKLCASDRGKTQQIESLQQALDKKEVKLQEAKQTIACLQRGLDEKEQHNEAAVREANQMVGRLESELERQGREVADVTQHNKALQQKLRELESLLSKTNQTVTCLQRNLEEKEREKEAAVREANQTVERLEGVLERRSKEAVSSTQYIEALQQNMRELEFRLSNAEVALEEASQTAACLQRELDEKILEKKAAAQQANQMVERLQSDLEQQREEINSVTQHNEALQHSVGELELLLSNAEAAVEISRQRLRESEEVLRVASQDIRMSDTNLGKGSYGEVRIAYWRGCPVAVKMLYEALAEYQRNVDLLLQEVSVAWKMHHPNVVAVCGIVLERKEKKTTAWIVMELLQGSMSAVINASLREEVGALTLRERVDMAHDSLCGLDYLHTLPRTVLHGDIRPTNILITVMMKAKLGDLGAARFSDASLSAGLLSPEYTAPERMDGRVTQKSKETDIYGMGVTVCELFTAVTPLPARREDQMHLIRLRSVRSVCLQMVSGDPRARPSAGEALTAIDRIRVIDEYRDCLPKRMVKGKVDGLRDVALVRHVVK